MMIVIVNFYWVLSHTSALPCKISFDPQLCIKQHPLLKQINHEVSEVQQWPFMSCSGNAWVQIVLLGGVTVLHAAIQGPGKAHIVPPPFLSTSESSASGWKRKKKAHPLCKSPPQEVARITHTHNLEARTSHMTLPGCRGCWEILCLAGQPLPSH